MAKTYQLQRCGESIEIEKEPEYFTAILPDKQVIDEVHQIQEIESVKQVFRKVYKIKAKASDRDGLMDHLRKDFDTRAIFHHAYNPVGDIRTRYYITDMIITRFKKGTKASTIEGIMQKYGLQWIKNYAGLKNTFLFRVTSSAGKNPVKLALDLASLAEVEFAEPNLVNRFDLAYDMKDELFEKQWHLKSKQDIELVRNADVSASAAWDITRGSRKVVVAVLDDGFDLYHPDLRGDGKKIIHPKDFVDGDAFPFPKRSNDDYHGTPCAGVAIGEENGSGIVGIAPKCSFLPIRFDLAADDNMLWNIFDYAGKYADVISCSWGPVPVYAPLHILLQEKFTQLATKGGPRRKGCVICFAAGNFNAPLNDPSNTSFVWRHPSAGLIDTPGRILNGNCVHPDVVAVSASTSLNRKAVYSNWGKEISVTAPSNNWHPLNPSAKEQGRGIWTTDNETFGYDFTDNSRYTGAFGGTSSATPLVAGIAALVLSANPKLSARQVKKILQESTDKIVDEQADSILGHQKGNYTNGHSEWFGYGKINAAKAVKKARALLDADKQKEKEAEAAKPIITEGVHIVAALVNPKGRESGNEKVSLFNCTDQTVDLKGWSLENGKGRSRKFRSGTSIAPGECLTVKTGSMPLSNRGGSILLINSEKTEVHRVSYVAKEVKKEGWFHTF
ncbi:MAG: S8 family serine peptidase [Bacteroidota bacterium]